MEEQLTAGDDGLDKLSLGDDDLEFLGDAGNELTGVERGDNSSIE